MPLPHSGIGVWVVSRAKFIFASNKKILQQINPFLYE